MRRLGLVWLGVIGLGLGVLASTASAIVVRMPDGQSLGVMPRPGVNAAAAPGLHSVATAPEGLRSAATVPETPAAGDLDYHGGVVLHATQAYLIFWDPDKTISDGTEGVFATYLTDTAGAGLVNSDVYAVGRQYTDGTGFADDGQSFSAPKQAIVDTQTYPTASSFACPTTASESACITDADLRKELTRLITADGLPVGHGADAPVYFIITPPDVNLCVNGSTCADNYFCAYHSSFTDSADGSQDVIYASIPLIDANKGCQDDNTKQLQAPNGVQSDGTAPDVAVDNMSHEYNEAITDPDGKSWYSNVSGNEEADNCESWGTIVDPADGENPDAYLPTLGSAANGSLFDQSIDGGEFYTQSEWSNGQANCFLEQTGVPPNPTFTTAEPGGNTVNFDPSASTSADGFSSTTWDFGDGTTSFAPGAPAPISYTYAGSGPESVTLTLVDDTGSLATVTETVNPSPPPPPSPPPGPSAPSPTSTPHAAFSSSPKHPASGLRVHFDASASTDTGATITAYAWNFGDGRTGSGARPSHTYRHPGRYRVTLTVTDSNDLGSTSSRGLHVVAPEKISKLALSRSGKRLKLTVKLTGPGTLQVGSRRHRVTRARTLVLRLALSLAKRRRLDRGQRFVYAVRVVFIPQAGRKVARTVRMKL